MKTNTQQINALATLAQPKPFDAVQKAHFLARELIGFNNASDKIIALQNEIEATKVEKGTRKKTIDALLKELWQNGVTMVEGTGVTKCPIRNELRRVLDETTLAKRTKDNIISAVAFAVNNKKPYDIKARDKYNAAIKAEKEKEKLKNEILKGASTPASSTPASTPAKVKGDTVKDYVKDMAILCQNAIQASEKRRMLKDDKEQVYKDIIELFNEVMDNMASLK